MYVLAKHTFFSILRSRIFWVMLIFSILLVSISGYFVTFSMIRSASFDGGRHEHDMDIEGPGDFFSRRDMPTRKEVDEMPMDIGNVGCGPGGDFMGQGFSTPLVSGIQYFGFISMAFFSNLAAVFLMMSLIPRELERRSIYTLLSKPLSRTDFFLGKLFGGWGALFFFNFVLGLMMVIFMFLAGAPFKSKFLLVAVISSLSPMLFGTVALVLGTFLRTTAVSFFTIVTLFFCTDAGNMMIFGVGKELLHWDKLTDFILTYLPPLQRIKSLVGAYIDYNLFSGITEMMQDLGSSVVSGKWWINAIWVAAYFIVLILVGWGVIRQKEFN